MQYFTTALLVLCFAASPAQADENAAADSSAAWWCTFFAKGMDLCDLDKEMCMYYKGRFDGSKCTSQPIAACYKYDTTRDGKTTHNTSCHSSLPVCYSIRMDTFQMSGPDVQYSNIASCVLVTP